MHSPYVTPENLQEFVGFAKPLIEQGNRLSWFELMEKWNESTPLHAANEVGVSQPSTMLEQPSHRSTKALQARLAAMQEKYGTFSDSAELIRQQRWERG